MQTIQKDPFRIVRYIALLFVTEIVHGDATKRRRFLGRLMRRIAQRIGIYAIAEAIYQTIYGLRCAMLSGSARAQALRYRHWMWATAGLSNHDYLRSWTAADYRGGPRIVVLGMGSIGDILQITPVLRALRQKMPNAQIALLHRSPAAPMVLRGNKNVDSIALIDFYGIEQIKRAIATEGAADLAVEIQSISYVVSYTRAPQVLRHPEFDRAMPDEMFTAAASARELWTKHPPVFPRKDDKFTWPAEWQPYQYLDVLGRTSGLPVDRNAALDFLIEPNDAQILSRLPTGAPIITIQNGVDTDVMNWSRATGRLATKLLPMKTWREIVRLLVAQNFTVVQLGGLDDEAIPGVTLDLRGKTTLREAAAILRHALCHVGTEGGLVHLARAMNTTSVVMFGPTSVAFLGYPQNVNLVASDCNSCWWTTRDWYVYCPRGLAEPECMHAHKAQSVADAVLSLNGAKVKAAT